jgi:AraC-like DNA-binding protein
MTALDSTSRQCAMRIDFVDDAFPRRSVLGDARYALIVVERGILEIDIDGQRVCLAARDATLVAPNRAWRLPRASARACWIARFDACDVDLDVSLAYARVHRLTAEQYEAVSAVLRLLSETGADRSASRQLVRRLHFTAVVASVLACADARAIAASGTNALVRDALEIVERRYAEYIGPAEIARELGRHPAYLTNLVREATGKSLGAWLIERRLGAARVLLCTTSDSVSEIAAAVGYVDASHFTRYFTRHFGAQPGRLRRLRLARDPVRNQIHAS